MGYLRIKRVAFKNDRGNKKRTVYVKRVMKSPLGVNIAEES